MMLGTSCSAGSDADYYLVDLKSIGLAVRGYSRTEVGGGFIYASFDKNTKETILNKYSQTECADEIAIQLLNFKASPLFTYHENGVYSNEGAFGRFVCMKAGMIPNDMISKNGTFRSLSKEFLDKYSDKIPLNFTESEFKDYTIFPLDDDQETARKLTDELNKAINSKK